MATPQDKKDTEKPEKDADPGNDMEKAQEEAAEERENEGGYQ